MHDLDAAETMLHELNGQFGEIFAVFPDLGFDTDACCFYSKAEAASLVKEEKS